MHRSIRAFIAVVAVLASWPASGPDRPRTEVARNRWESGEVNLHPTEPPDEVLDRLVLEERFLDAFRHALAGLRERATRLGAMHPATLASLERVGVVTYLARDLATAEEVLEATERARREVSGPADPALPELLMRRGMVARHTNQRERARGFYDEAEQLLAGRDETWDDLRADLEQARAAWVRRTDWDASVAHYRRALALRRNTSAVPSFSRANTLTWLGWSLSRVGKIDEARGLLLEAKEQLRALGVPLHSLRAVIDNVLADDRMRADSWDEAELLYRSTAEILDRARERHLVGFSRRSYPRDGYEALAVIAILRGRFEEAWTLRQRAVGALYNDFALLGLWRERDPAGFRSVRALRRELLDVRRILAAARRRDAGAWAPTTWSSFLEALDLRARIDGLEAEYLRTHALPAPSLARTQESLDAHTALVGSAILALWTESERAPHRFWGWNYVLRRDQPIHWVPFPVSDGPEPRDLGLTWERILRAASWPQRVEPDPAVLRGLRLWARRFVDPIEPHLNGIRQVVVEGNMIGIDSLVMSDGRFFGERFEVHGTPSASLQYAFAGTPRERSIVPPRSVLTVSATVGESGEAETEPIRRIRDSFPRRGTPLENLPKLQFAGAEAREVARMFPVSTILEGASLEHRLWTLADRGALRSFDVLHFATHTLADGVPERCALALGDCDASSSPDDDGMLDLEEILLGWDLDASLLTFSGCETTKGAGIDRGEALGFAPAALAAGARAVLSSEWAVDDRATRLLMERFYENLTGRHSAPRMGYPGPMPASQALREAKKFLRELTDGEGRRLYEHPVYWAGFSLMERNLLGP